MRNARSVYLVQHVRDEKDETAKVIGIYSDEQHATLAIDKLRKKPGFRASPNGFYIDEYIINEDNWSEGFGV